MIEKSEEPFARCFRGKNHYHQGKDKNTEKGGRIFFLKIE